MRRYWLILVLLLITFALVIWTSDHVTLQGERTVYTVQCEKGTWVDSECSGKLAAAERYRYRALAARGEVLFWVVGSPEPSGKLTRCEIHDGRNWSCKANANTDAARSITLEMSKGQAVHDKTGATRPLHEASKVVWLLLKYKVHFGVASVRQ